MSLWEAARGRVGASAELLGALLPERLRYSDEAHAAALLLAEALGSLTTIASALTTMPKG